MTFSFHHLKVDYPNGDKWTKADFDFIKLKEIMSIGKLKCKKGGDGMRYSGVIMTSLVLCHALVMIRGNESAKMLATAMHMLQAHLTFIKVKKSV